MHHSPSDQCHYRVDAPYPPISVEGPNPTYACEMLSNMAEVVSEMSDVSRYFYIAVVTRQSHSEISDCFHHISVVEMHHLDIFAEFACLLGADPRLWSAGKRWWSPSFIGYPRGLRALIAESIRAEQAAISKYSRQTETICDLHIVAMLNRIILDEEQHLQTFKEMYSRLEESESGRRHSPDR